MKELRLSLIVATYNRADRITQCLDSIVEQTAESASWEAIIVNNNSTDNTIEVVEQFIQQHPTHNIHLVTERKQGLSHARNCGIERAKAPIIAIIDDDEEVVPQYTEAYLNFFDQHLEVATAGGAIIAKYDSPPPHWLSPLTEIPIANPIAPKGNIRPFPKGKIPGGGNMAIRRSAIEKYGVFDPELGRRGNQLLGGEESNLFERLRSGGEQIWLVPEAAIYHNISDDKLQRKYLDKLWFNIGVSQLRRAHIEGVSTHRIWVRESSKWLVTLALALLYILTLRPTKGWYLIVMRRHISRGIASAYNDKPSK